MNRGYSTVQVARMLGVDEQTLLSLLEVNRRPELEEAPTSEIAVERAHHKEQERAKKVLTMSDDAFRQEVHDLLAAKTAQGMNGTVKTIAFWLVIGLSALLLWQVIQAGR
jgi:hypothetical protein